MKNELIRHKTGLISIKCIMHEILNQFCFQITGLIAVGIWCYHYVRRFNLKKKELITIRSKSRNRRSQTAISHRVSELDNIVPRLSLYKWALLEVQSTSSRWRSNIFQVLSLDVTQITMASQNVLISNLYFRKKNQQNYVGAIKWHGVKYVEII